MTANRKEFAKQATTTTTTTTITAVSHQQHKKTYEPSLQTSTSIPTTIEASKTTSKVTGASENVNRSLHNCDILLNNFQIKKKRYRVLLNFDHIVWERFDLKKGNVYNSGTSSVNNSGSSGNINHENNHGFNNNITNEKLSKQETETETEQLAQKSNYGNDSKVLHINEVIRVTKGRTKAETLSTMTNVGNAFATAQQHIHGQMVSSVPTNITASPPLEQYLTIYYAERVIKSSVDCNRWRIRTLTLYNADAYVIRQWHTLLEKMLQNTARCRVKRLLVFINPYGGRKHGLQSYERYCKPLFQLAGIDASCIISQRANQIRDILMSHDLSNYDAVCCVGGDGTVAEIINGLIFRAMHDLDLDPIQPAYIPKPQLPLAIIPAGSTDTVAYSLHGTSDERTAAIHLILGQTRGLDICSVRNPHGLIRFCASVLSYGYLGDVAANSEKYRWMGTKRYEFAGVKAFLLNRGYEAELRIAEEDEDLSDLTDDSLQTGNIINEQPTNLRSSSICYDECQRCDVAAQNIHTLEKCGDANVEVNDEDLPTSSNASLYAQKSNNDNTDTQVMNKLNSMTCFYDDKPKKIRDVNKIKYDNNNEDHNNDNDNNVNDDVDNIRNINMENCDRNAKILMIQNQLQKDKQIKALLTVKDIEENLQVPSVINENDLKIPTTTTTSMEPKSLSYASTTSINNNNVNSTTLPKWKVVKGQFFMISGANITCACSRSPNGISRFNHLGDGNLDLILVRKTSLWNNIRFCINTMGRNGDIRNLPFVETYRTKKFSFQTPYTNNEENYSVAGSCQPIADLYHGVSNDENVSRWNCDGEVVNDLDITMTSHCQLVDVFMRGPHKYSKPSNSEKKSSLFCCCNKREE